MLYIIPTKRGKGVQIWGAYDDLNTLHDFINKFRLDEDNLNKGGTKNRDKLISSFSDEIRKAKEERRLARNKSHLFFDEQKYLGCHISWVHFLFSLTTIRYNMRFIQVSKFDKAQMLLLEHWLEKAMKTYDPIGAGDLICFIEDGIYSANPYIYQYMRSINMDFHLLDGGEKTFRKLPHLLNKAILFTDEFKEYEQFLKREAKRLNCEITELEVNDEEVDYDFKKW